MHGILPQMIAAKGAAGPFQSNLMEYARTIERSGLSGVRCFPIFLSSIQYRKDKLVLCGMVFLYVLLLSLFCMPSLFHKDGRKGCFLCLAFLFSPSE